MKKSQLIITAAAAVGVFLFGLLMNTACKKEERVQPAEAKAIWEEHIGLIESYIDGIGQAETPGAAAEQIRAFSAGLKRLEPRINDILGRFTAEAAAATESESEILAKLVAVLTFSDRLVNMDVKKFREEPEVAGARGELIDIQMQIRGDQAAVNGDKVKQEYMNLIEGRITGGEALERFSQKLGKASLTSKIKLTMNILSSLGKAIDAFARDYGYVPEVGSLEELSYYKSFVPLYIDPLITDDAWGNKLHYKAEGSRFWLGSGGSDGRFEGFTQQGTYTELEGKDIILSGGAFIYGPDTPKN